MYTKSSQVIFNSCGSIMLPHRDDRREWCRSMTQDASCHSCLPSKQEWCRPWHKTPSIHRKSWKAGFRARFYRHGRHEERSYYLEERPKLSEKEPSMSLPQCCSKIGACAWKHCTERSITVGFWPQVIDWTLLSQNEGHTWMQVHTLYQRYSVVVELINK